LSSAAEKASLEIRWISQCKSARSEGREAKAAMINDESNKLKKDTPMEDQRRMLNTLSDLLMPSVSLARN
jgi:hypothetical protein